MPDLRYAFRLLLRTPVITSVLILSLALGIGANTAMYSLMHQMLLRVLPVQNPQELVFFYQPGPVQGNVSSDEKDMPSFSYPMLRDLQAKQTPFTGIAGMRSTGGSLSYQNAALPGLVEQVTGNYFDVLGVKPALGRLFSEEDDRTPGAHYVTVLSFGYWTARLGGRADVLNQKLTVNGYPMTIVGVAPKGFAGVTLGTVPDVYVPISMRAQVAPGWNGYRNRQDYWIYLVARMKPGVTRERAAEEINSVYRTLLPEEANLLVQPSKQTLEQFLNKRIVLRPGDRGRGGMRREAETPVNLLMGITIFVLMIACANAANLLLSQAAGRRKEIAVRLSMGASRGRLLRQLLVEAWIVSLAGGLLGVFVAQWTLDAMLAAIPKSAINAGFLSSQLDARILLYCLGASLLTGLAFGLYPAVQATRPDVASVLKAQGDQLMGARSRWFRGSLVAGQVALSLMLLVTAGLFVLSLMKLTRVDIGMDVDRMIHFELSPQLARYNSVQSLQFFDRLEERLLGTPGVSMVAGSTVALLSGDNWSSSIRVEGYQEKGDSSTHARYSQVSPGFFATIGTPLLDGREFTRADGAGTPKVAIVNETFVKQFFRGENALGRRFALGIRNSGALDIEIVGVVKNSRMSEMQEKPNPVFYRPYRQQEKIGAMNFYVRTTIEPQQFAAIIRREVASLDPSVPVDELKTMRAQVNENMFAERFMSTFAGTFAGLATLLAAVGLYGVLAYTVSRRTREIGIRMALGAGSGAVRRLVMKDVLRMVGAGAVIGLAGALALGRSLESMLYGVGSRDFAVIGGATLLLAVVALVAGYVPARRATRIHPMIALRE